MVRNTITAKNAVAVGPYSHAVIADKLVYLSGQTPIVPETGKLLVGTITEKTHQCFRNLEAVLDAGSMTFDNVLKVNVFLTDMHAFSEMNDVYQNYFKEPYPARTTIGVATLPLFADIEIEMIARK